MITTAMRKLTVMNKTVYCRNAYVPRYEDNSGFEGREKEMELIMACLIAGKNTLPLMPLLVGECGVGKNKIVVEVARRLGKELHIFPGHENVTAESFAVDLRIPDGGAKIEYILSPLTTAMSIKGGGICLIDELDKIRADALAILASLDERRFLESNLLAASIICDNGFRLIAAANSVNGIPENILSRFRPIIYIGYPSRQVIDNIIRNLCKVQGREIDRLIDRFWVLCTDFKKEGQITPRDAIYLISLAGKLSLFEKTGGHSWLMGKSGEYQVDLTSDEDLTGIRPEHLESAFRELFNEAAHESAKYETHTVA